MISRRRLLEAAAAWPLAALSPARAQQHRIPRIGILLFNSPRTDYIVPLIEGLKALGYVDGQGAVFDYRYADGNAERLPLLAAELVRLRPDVIFAYGGDVAPYAKNATDSIPIVVMVSNDPVQTGLVASLARPGANVTGLTLIYDELAGKVLELLKEAVPSMSHCGVLWNPEHADPEYRYTQRSAATVGVRLQSLEVRRASDFEGAFRAAVDGRAEGLVVVSSRVLFQKRKEIAEFAAQRRIPMAGGWGDWTKDGFLLTYGPNTVDAMRRIPIYIDKILKGANPATLPIERPAKFQLVVNLKTAKELGITMPQSLLLRADEVIQ
jgi:putative ABC transport system substrate-binding protein